MCIATGAPATLEPSGNFWLDVKFVEGVREMRKWWDGPVRVLAPTAPKAVVPFGSYFDREELEFDLHVGDPSSFQDELAGAAAVMSPLDSYDQLSIPVEASRRGTTSIIIAEISFANQLRLTLRDAGSAFGKAKTVAWQLGMERHRRRAVRHAAGMQCNGVPSYEAYGPYNDDSICFFDTRVRAEQFATPADMEARRGRAARDEPLNLVFSGRFETIKGADRLIPTFARMVRDGSRANLHLFGTGSLEAGMRRQIAAASLEGRVIMHGSVPFEDGLLPWMRENADVFLCAHPQSDPSCTYMETLSSGVPIVGYANAAFSGMAEAGPVGWSVPVHDDAAMAETVRGLEGDRHALAEMSGRVLAFARGHSFEATMARRIRQVTDAAKRGSAREAASRSYPVQHAPALAPSLGR